MRFGSTMPRSKRIIRLGPRDLEILSFIGQERTTWLEVIHRRFYEGRQLDAVRSTMRRLCGHAPEFRYVRSELLDGQRNFYRLTRQGARLVGFPDHVTSPVGTTALVRRYALQWFIEIDGRNRRWRCNPRDYPEMFSLDGHRLPRANFYVEQMPDETMLGFAIEDYGSDVRRLSRRACDLLQRFLEHGWFDELMGAQRFAITFLTSDTGKAKAIEKQFLRDSQRRLATMLRQIPSETSASVIAESICVPGLAELVLPKS